MKAVTAAEPAIDRLKSTAAVVEMIKRSRRVNVVWRVAIVVLTITVVLRIGLSAFRRGEEAKSEERRYPFPSLQATFLIS